MAKLIRIQKPGGGWAIGRRNGKLVTDEGGAPCCCGGGHTICGVPSPICSILRAGVDTCSVDRDLGGRYAVEIELTDLTWEWDRDLRVFEYQNATGGRYFVSYQITNSNASATLSEPVRWKYVIAYCPDTGNWIACVANPSVDNRREVNISYQWSVLACGESLRNIADRDNWTPCTPAPGNPNLRIDDSGSGFYTPMSVGINSANSGYQTQAQMCRGESQVAYRRTAAFDSGASSDPDNFTAPNTVGRLIGVDDTEFGNLYNACGSMPFVFIEDGDGVRPVSCGITGALPDQSSTNPNGFPFGVARSGWSISKNPPLTVDPDDYTSSVSGSQTVSESVGSDTFTKSFSLNYSGAYSVGLDPLRNMDSVNASGSASGKVTYTKIDDCTGGIPLPPGLDEYGRPLPPPGKCQGCGG